MQDSKTEKTKTNQQSIDSIANRVSLSGLIEFTLEFKSQENRFCWANLCLPIRTKIFNLDYDTSLEVLSTVRTLLKILRG